MDATKPSPFIDESGFNTGIILYTALSIVALVAMVYFGRAFLIRRRVKKQAVAKFADFESGPPPMYVDDDKKNPLVFDSRPRSILPTPLNTTAATCTTQAPSTPTASSPTSPKSALIRGEGYYIATPRTHSRSSSAASARSLGHQTSPVAPMARVSETTEFTTATKTTTLPAYDDLVQK